VSSRKKIGRRGRLRTKRLPPKKLLSSKRSATWRQLLIMSRGSGTGSRPRVNILPRRERVRKEEKKAKRRSDLFGL